MIYSSGVFDLLTDKRPRILSILQKIVSGDRTYAPFWRLATLIENPMIALVVYMDASESAPEEIVASYFDFPQIDIDVSTLETDSAKIATILSVMSARINLVPEKTTIRHTRMPGQRPCLQCSQSDKLFSRFAATRTDVSNRFYRCLTVVAGDSTAIVDESLITLVERGTDTCIFSRVMDLFARDGVYIARTPVLPRADAVSRLLDSIYDRRVANPPPWRPSYDLSDARELATDRTVWFTGLARRVHNHALRVCFNRNIGPAIVEIPGTDAIVLSPNDDGFLDGGETKVDEGELDLECDSELECTGDTMSMQTMKALARKYNVALARNIRFREVLNITIPSTTRSNVDPDAPGSNSGRYYLFGEVGFPTKRRREDTVTLLQEQINTTPLQPSEQEMPVFVHRKERKMRRPVNPRDNAPKERAGEPGQDRPDVRQVRRQPLNIATERARHIHLRFDGMCSKPTGLMFLDIASDENVRAFGTGALDKGGVILHEETEVLASSPILDIEFGGSESGVKFEIRTLVLDKNKYAKEGRKLRIISQYDYGNGDKRRIDVYKLWDSILYALKTFWPIAAEIAVVSILCSKLSVSSATAYSPGEMFEGVHAIVHHFRPGKLRDGLDMIQLKYVVRIGLPISMDLNGWSPAQTLTMLVLWLELRNEAKFIVQLDSEPNVISRYEDWKHPLRFTHRLPLRIIREIDGSPNSDVGKWEHMVSANVRSVLSNAFVQVP